MGTMADTTNEDPDKAQAPDAIAEFASMIASLFNSFDSPSMVAWRAKSEEYMRQYNLKYPSPVSPQKRFKIFKRDHYRCQICGRTAQDGLTLEVDHKIPRTKGGGNHPDNLWTLCRTCNRGKGDRDL